MCLIRYLWNKRKGNNSGDIELAVHTSPAYYNNIFLDILTNRKEKIHTYRPIQ